MERLGRDLQADEDQDREDDRLGDQVEDPVEVAEDPRRADEQGRRQRVAGPGPHRLVGGMADVGGRLDHAAEEPADQGGQPLGGDDLAGRIVVARPPRRSRCSRCRRRPWPGPAGSPPAGSRPPRARTAANQSTTRPTGSGRTSRSQADGPAPLAAQARARARARASHNRPGSRRPRPPGPRGSGRGAPSAPSASPGSRASDDEPRDRLRRRCPAAAGS